MNVEDKTMDFKDKKDLEKALRRKIKGLEDVQFEEDRNKHHKIVLSGSGRSAFIFVSATPSGRRAKLNAVCTAGKAFRNAKATTGSDEAA